MVSTARLYHYTCDHSLAGIRRIRHLMPHVQPLLGDIQLIWLTDMAVPDRLALGLTSVSLNCDRTKHRITVPADSHMVKPWIRFARKLPMEQRHALELASGARPMHWWVARNPVPVVEIDGEELTRG
jgi:hypothetical protein